MPTINLWLQTADPGEVEIEQIVSDQREEPTGVSSRRRAPAILRTAAVRFTELAVHYDDWSESTA
jgi:hypothetical protein